MVKRYKGIGGSDMPKVYLGAVYGSTAADLNEQLRGIQERPRLSNKAIDRGNRNEPIAAIEIREQLGWDLREYNDDEEFFHRDLDWAYAHIDGIATIEGEKYLVEIKCPSLSNWYTARDNGPHDYWIIQCQHYMNVLDNCDEFPGGVVGAKLVLMECDGYRLQVYDIPNDKDFQAKMMLKGAAFMDAVNSDKPWNSIRGEVPIKIGGETYTADDEIDGLLDSMKRARDEKLKWEQIEKDARGKIEELWPVDQTGQMYKRIRGKTASASWSGGKARYRVDVKALKGKHPDAYADCMVVSRGSEYMTVRYRQDKKEETK